VERVKIALLLHYDISTSKQVLEVSTMMTCTTTRTHAQLCMPGQPVKDSITERDPCSVQQQKKVQHSYYSCLVVSY
jgi:hypothetical protein